MLKALYNTSQSSTQAHSETVLLVPGDYVVRAAMKALNDKVNQPHRIITLLHSQMLSTKQEGSRSHFYSLWYDSAGD